MSKTEQKNWNIYRMNKVIEDGNIMRDILLLLKKCLIVKKKIEKFLQCFLTWKKNNRRYNVMSMYSKFK